MKKKGWSWLVLPLAAIFGVITYLTIQRVAYAPTFYFLQAALCMMVVIVLGLEVGYLFSFLGTLAGVAAVLTAATNMAAVLLMTEIVLIWTVMSLASFFEGLREKDHHVYEAMLDKTGRTLAQLRREIAAYGVRIEAVRTQTEFRTRLAKGAAMIGQSLNPAHIQEALKDALRLNFPRMETDVFWFDLDNDNGLDSFERWVQENRRFLLVSDTQKDERFRRALARDSSCPYRSLAIVPFHEGGSPGRLGVLRVASKEPAQLTQEDIRVLDLYALLGNIGFENASLNQKVEDMAFHDALTGVYTRKMFDERLIEECGQASRFRLNLSMALVDIDHFKSFNDRFGHQVGDRLLEWLAKLLRQTLREVDFLSRYGGEEFVVLFPETPKKEAVSIMERIRQEVESRGFILDGSARLGATVSVGVASFPDETSTPQQLLRAADERLYMAKGMGRNKVVSD
ncbi:MAG: sensor domain-containing diguanylate cyclase [Elusimicrobia bacterium]|nr:sensor domain-containing diguanylate cyclase [Elusimicrobiota bacterium]